MYNEWWSIVNNYIQKKRQRLIGVEVSFFLQIKHNMYQWANHNMYQWTNHLNGMGVPYTCTFNLNYLFTQLNYFIDITNISNIITNGHDRQLELYVCVCLKLLSHEIVPCLFMWLANRPISQLCKVMCSNGTLYPHCY